MKAARQSIGGLGNLMFKQAYLISEMLDGHIPDVYLQDEKYFAHHAPDIRASFSEGIGATDKVAIHVRLGDYIGNSFHVDLTRTDYYQRAIAQFPPDTEFIVFCRDRQSPTRDTIDRMWCVSEFNKLLGDRFEMSPYDDYETDDMNGMASCKGIIMANSSFSWWAAYLGDPNKTVICPKEWFTDGNMRVGLPLTWIQL